MLSVANVSGKRTFVSWDVWWTNALPPDTSAADNVPSLFSVVFWIFSTNTKHKQLVNGLKESSKSLLDIYAYQCSYLFVISKKIILEPSTVFSLWKTLCKKNCLLFSRKYRYWNIARLYRWKTCPIISWLNLADDIIKYLTGLK